MISSAATKNVENPSLTILIASTNVTLNSLRRFAWPFNFLLHACSGGEALSKSNCKGRRTLKRIFVNRVKISQTFMMFSRKR